MVILKNKKHSFSVIYKTKKSFSGNLLIEGANYLPKKAYFCSRNPKNGLTPSQKGAEFFSWTTTQKTDI